MNSSPATSSKKKKASGPLKPKDVRVVSVVGRILIYRSGGVIRETDSMGRSTGILTGQGLMGTPHKKSIKWVPSFFRFREESAEETTYEPDSEHHAQWLLAGVVIGERTVRIKKRNDAFHAETGRNQDQAIAIDIWQKWIQWREAGSVEPFHQFMRVGKYDGYEADALRKQLSRIGLSTARPAKKATE